VVAQLTNVDYLEVLGRTIVRHSARRPHPPFVPLLPKGWVRDQNILGYNSELHIYSFTYRWVMGTDGIQSLRRNYILPSRPYLGMMPWRSLEARAPSCQPWPLYLAKMWPRERTKVIMVNFVSRCRTMAVFHHRRRVFRSLYLR
jgi:hypothetical protein